ncbi:unnamed protein product [Protopolystoma xenopodis]|uniref:Uncharacterized protein n=1 Tax=Protopolystoma xenopodis TaxID=117903 RepID=A0A3S5CU38_9PLAT|nr:unnamed protein product [Protopolystoma xenopodis]
MSSEVEVANRIRAGLIGIATLACIRPPSSFGLVHFCSISSSMKSCSYGVCHEGTDESSVQVIRGGRTVSRSLIGTIQQPSLRDNSPSVSGETT